MRKKFWVEPNGLKYAVYVATTDFGGSIVKATFENELTLSAATALCDSMNTAHKHATIALLEAA